MSDQTLLVEDRGAVRLVTLNRPKKRNAITVRMASELGRALRQAMGDEAVRVVVLTGAGDIFCAGVDVSLFLGQAEDMSDWPADEVLQPMSITRCLAECAKPVIAAVNGAAVGMATTILPHFDLVYASDRATFSTPFVKLGLVVEFGASYTLPRLIGAQRTAEMVLRGTPIDARTACDWGLVARVFPAESFLSSVIEIARDIAENPTLTVQRNKDLLRRGVLAEDMYEAMQIENEVLGTCYGSPENVAAVQAFLSKRR